MRKKVCVFCASAGSTPQVILDSAYAMGLKLGKAGFDLVWGGCHSASMGMVARGVQESGGKLFGFIPQHFIDDGQAYADADELIAVEHLQERKQRMRDTSDAFLVLPGGFGTMDELFDLLACQIITMRKGEETKPVVIHDQDSFFRFLNLFMDSLYRNELAARSYRKLYSFARHPDQVVELLQKATQ